MAAGIGATLKEARTKKDLSLEDVHAKIKVHPRVLQLLEEEKFEKLPSPLFAKSFLRSYAQFLDVDADQLIDSYEKEKKPSSEPDQKVFLRPTPLVPERKLPISWAVAGGVLAALFALYLSGAPAKLGAWTAQMRENAAQAAKKNRTAEKKPVVKPQPPKEEASQWLNTPALGNFPKIKKGVPLDLQIRALDAVWVHVTGDGKVLFQGVLKKGAAEAWRAKDSIEIWTGNASNMALSLNRVNLGSPGKGVVKKMVISHDGVRIAPSGA